jgi:hypothetical protein
MPNQATLENWERLSRAEDAEWERQYRALFDAAVEKLQRSQEPGRRRPPALSIKEMWALHKFVQKHHSD